MLGDGRAYCYRSRMEPRAEGTELELCKDGMESSHHDSLSNQINMNTVTHPYKYGLSKYQMKQSVEGNHPITWEIRI